MTASLKRRPWKERQRSCLSTETRLRVGGMQARTKLRSPLSPYSTKSLCIALEEKGQQGATRRLRCTETEKKKKRPTSTPGLGNSIFLSMRPGRRRASSRISILLVHIITCPGEKEEKWKETEKKERPPLSRSLLLQKERQPRPRLPVLFASSLTEPS